MLSSSVNLVLNRIVELGESIHTNQISNRDALMTIKVLHRSIEIILYTMQTDDISLYETYGILHVLGLHFSELNDLYRRITGDNLVLEFPNHHGCGYWDGEHLLIFAHDDDFAVTVNKQGMPDFIPLCLLAKCDGEPDHE